MSSTTRAGRRSCFTHTSPDGARRLSGHACGPSRVHADRRQRADHRILAPRPTSRPSSTSRSTATSTWRATVPATSRLTASRSNADRYHARRRGTRFRPASWRPSQARRSISDPRRRIGDRIDADACAAQGEQRLRPQLRADAQGPGPRAGRACRRSRHRPHDGGLDDRAGHPVLHRQQARWLDGGQGRPRLQGARPASASRRSTFPTRRTSRAFRPPCSGPAKQYRSTTVFKFGVS